MNVWILWVWYPLHSDESEILAIFLSERGAQEAEALLEDEASQKEPRYPGNRPRYTIVGYRAAP